MFLQVKLTFGVSLTMSFSSIAQTKSGTWRIRRDWTEFSAFSVLMAIVAESIERIEPGRKSYQWVITDESYHCSQYRSSCQRAPCCADSRPRFLRYESPLFESTHFQLVLHLDQTADISRFTIRLIVWAWISWRRLSSWQNIQSKLLQ